MWERKPWWNKVEEANEKLFWRLNEILTAMLSSGVQIYKVMQIESKWYEVMLRKSGLGIP